MKKFLLAIICAAYLFFAAGCSVFKKKDTYGCPANGRNIGAEKLAQGDDKALKASAKAKYKGGNKGF